MESHEPVDRSFNEYSTTYDLISQDANGAALLNGGAQLCFTDYLGDDSSFICLDFEKGDRTLLESDANAPVIDPSGRLIAFLAPGLVVTEIGSKEHREILAPKEGARVGFLDWSADSRYILATRIRADGSDLIVVDVESGTQLLSIPLPFGDAALEMNASFRRDGKQFAFDGPLGADTSWNVAIVSMDSLEQTRVTSGGQDNILLGYSADPHSLVIARDTAGTWDAVLVERRKNQTSETTQVLRRDLGEIRSRGSNSSNGCYAVQTYDWSKSLEIIVLNPSGTVERSTEINAPLASGSRATWFTDGESVMYASGSGARGFRLMLAKDGATEKLDTLPGVMRFGGHAFEPRLSLDGAAILFQGRSYSGGRIDSNGIYVKILGRSGVRPIVQTEGSCPWDCLEWPCWLGANSLAYTRWENPWPSRSIFFKDIRSGSVELLLTSDAEIIAHLEGSPDGEGIAYVCWIPSTGFGEVRIIHIPTGKVERVMEFEQPVLSEYRQPHAALAWSPDGKWLYFAFSIDGEAHSALQLWRISIEDAQKRLILSRSDVAPFGLSMNPDGRRLALSSGTEMSPNLSLLRINSERSAHRDSGSS